MVTRVPNDDADGPPSTGEVFCKIRVLLGGGLGERALRQVASGIGLQHRRVFIAGLVQRPSVPIQQHGPPLGKARQLGQGQPPIRQPVEQPVQQPQPLRGRQVAECRLAVQRPPGPGGQRPRVVQVRPGAQRDQRLAQQEQALRGAVQVDEPGAEQRVQQAPTRVEPRAAQGEEAAEPGECRLAVGLGQLAGAGKLRAQGGSGLVQPTEVQRAGEQGHGPEQHVRQAGRVEALARLVETPAVGWRHAAVVALGKQASEGGEGGRALLLPEPV